MSTVEKKIPVAILIPNYNGKHLLHDCLSSVFSAEYDTVDPHVYLIDNASTDDSVEFVKANWPDTNIIVLDTNTGYTGANNRGWEQAVQDIPDLKYIYLLNSDTIVEKNFLTLAVSYMEKDPTCGSAQSQLRLYPETNKINSLGNRIHFLGFGYASHCNETINDVPITTREINYASGAAALVRLKTIEDIGLFDDFMFMYLEDLDLGWRIILSGMSNILVPESIVYHKFEFKRGMKQYYFFERNRLWILFSNYKIGTLLLLVPAFLFMEFGQILFAYMNDRLHDKLRSYIYFFSVRNLNTLFEQRKKIRRLRKRSDREMLHVFTGSIIYQPLDHFMVRYIANPILSLYLLILKKLVVW